MSTFNQNYDHTNNRPPNPRDQCEELVVKPFGKTTKNVQYLSHAQEMFIVDHFVTVDQYIENYLELQLLLKTAFNM